MTMYTETVSTERQVRGDASKKPVVLGYAVAVGGSLGVWALIALVVSQLF